MSMETVLKQVFTFVTILNKAQTEEVCRWELRSIRNAFNWSKYAEEVHTKIKDRSFRKDFEEKLKEMTLYLSPPSCLQLNFDDLRKASEIMFFTLIQNSHFPEKWAQDVFVAFNESTEKLDVQFYEKCSSLTSDLTTLAIGDNLHVEDKDISKYHAQGSVMLDALSTAVHGIPDPSKTDSYINNLLERLSSFNNGFSVIVSMYIQAGLSADKSKQNVCQSIFRFFKHLGHKFVIHKACDGLITQAASLDHQFGELAINLLLGEAESFEISYNDKELYSWMKKDTCNQHPITFKDLCKYFSMLYSINKNLTDTIKSRLDELSELSFVNIYRDIRKTLL